MAPVAAFMVALALGLVAQSSVAADAKLVIVSHCGVPALFIATYGVTTIHITPDEALHTRFFSDFLLKTIKAVDAQRGRIVRLRVEELSKIPCPLRASTDKQPPG